jgi:hypothetical protein
MIYGHLWLFFFTYTTNLGMYTLAGFDLTTHPLLIGHDTSRPGRQDRGHFLKGG